MSRLESFLHEDKRTILILLQVAFWLCVSLVFYSYLIYPILISILTIGKRNNQIIFPDDVSECPQVDILLSVNNEEKVISEKIETTFDTCYPLDKIYFHIGSDASNDKTESIIRQYTDRYPQLRFTSFSKKGKLGTINTLSQQLSSPIIIFTDANVFFTQDTLYHLIKHFKNKTVGLVGGKIINQQNIPSGISLQESFYQEREFHIKYLEGLWGGVMMGAFGGCYAVRRECFSQVPSNHLVDDFHITLGILCKGFKAIAEPEAIAVEDVSIKITEEFRRRVRISTGNFQNLKAFSSILLNPFSKLFFAFFSHKILRWFTPFLMISVLILNIALFKLNKFYLSTLIVQAILLLLPLVDSLLKNIDINFTIFRFVTHFYAMNLALLVGFFRFLIGVKTNVWRPTERNQK